MLFTFAQCAAAHADQRHARRRKGSNPSLLIGACIVLPQIIVALASPAVGRFADRYGRRLVLIVGFADAAVARADFLDHVQLRRW